MPSEPFFILGNRRSGTTLLRLMLTSHPDLLVPPEGGFIYLLGWKYGNKNFEDNQTLKHFLDDLFSHPNIVDWELSREELVQNIKDVKEYSDVIDCLYHTFSLKKYGRKKKRWGDKSTGFIAHIDDLKTYFPACKFVHLVRDPRSIVSSYKKVPHLTSETRDIIYEWKWNVNFVNRYRSKIDNEDFIEVKYEDLVQNPENELIKICELLNENYSTEMLDYWKKNREKKLEPERHMGWKKLTKEKPKTKGIDSWKKKLSNSDIQLTNKICFDEMKQYGYEFQVDNHMSLNFSYLIYHYKEYLKKPLRKVKYKFE